MCYGLHTCKPRQTPNNFIINTRFHSGPRKDLASPITSILTNQERVVVNQGSFTTNESVESGRGVWQGSLAQVGHQDGVTSAFFMPERNHGWE